MTPNTGATQTNRPSAAAGTQNAAAARSGGMFGNFGRSMLGGLLVGGLIGMLLGNGLGGMAGMFGLLLQVAVIALIAMFVMRMIANRRQTAAAGAGNAGAQPLMLHRFWFCKDCCTTVKYYKPHAFGKSLWR